MKNTIEVPISEHDNIVFKTFAQRFEIDGEPVECHLREPGKEPAIKIKGKWHVVKFRDMAGAILGREGTQGNAKSKGGA